MRRGQFSTARDMALLGKALIHDVPEEYAIHKEKEFTFNKIRQPNRNRLLWSSNLNVDGMKTGTTAGAGYNLVASATQGRYAFDLRSTGCEKLTVSVFNESEKLLTWGFRFFETVTPIKPDATFVTQRVWFGDKSEVNLGGRRSGLSDHTAWADEKPESELHVNGTAAYRTAEKKVRLSGPLISSLTVNPLSSVR